MKNILVSFVISRPVAFFWARVFLSVATAATLIAGHTCSKGALYGEVGMGWWGGPLVLLADRFDPEQDVGYWLWGLGLFLFFVVIMALVSLLGAALIGSLVLAVWPREVVVPLRVAAWSLGLLAGLLGIGLGAALWLTTHPGFDGPKTINPAHFLLPAILALLAMAYARLYRAARRLN